MAWSSAVGTSFGTWGRWSIDSDHMTLDLVDDHGKMRCCISLMPNKYRTDVLRKILNFRAMKADGITAQDLCDLVDALSAIYGASLIHGFVEVQPEYRSVITKRYAKE